VPVHDISVSMISRPARKSNTVYFFRNFTQIAAERIVYFHLIC